MKTETIWSKNWTINKFEIGNRYQQHTREVIVEVWPRHMKKYAIRHDLYWMRLIRCPLGVFDASVHIQLNDDNVVHHLNYLVDERLLVAVVHTDVLFLIIWFFFF